MYIGPWQEYKLAHVIKLKNDLYEGALSPKLTEKALILHNQRTLTTDSNSTDRTFISENKQKKYPKFDLDTYYKHWRQIEGVLTKSEATELIPKKPMVPKADNRKRFPKSIQAQRISKMRVVYGLYNKQEVKLPAIVKNTVFVEEKEKKREKISLPMIHPKIKDDEDEQVDGLLQWVKELPEELSICSSEMSKHGV